MMLVKLFKDNELIIDIILKISCIFVDKINASHMTTSTKTLDIVITSTYVEHIIQIFYWKYDAV